MAAQGGVAKAEKCTSDDNWFPFWSLANPLALSAFRDPLATCLDSQRRAGTAAGLQGACDLPSQQQQKNGSFNVTPTLSLPLPQGGAGLGW